MVEVYTACLPLTDRGEAYGLVLDGLLLVGLFICSVENGFVSKFYYVSI